jgi:hypothetical protein
MYKDYSQPPEVPRSENELRRIRDEERGGFIAPNPELIQQNERLYGGVQEISSSVSSILSDLQAALNQNSQFQAETTPTDFANSSTFDPSAAFAETGDKFIKGASTIADANSQLANVVTDLANKDWSVNVYVNGNQSGPALGGVG